MRGMCDWWPVWGLMRGNDPNWRVSLVSSCNERRGRCLFWCRFLPMCLLSNRRISHFFKELIPRHLKLHSETQRMLNRSQTECAVRLKVQRLKSEDDDSAVKTNREIKWWHVWISSAVDTWTFLNYTEAETEDRHKQTASCRLRYSTEGKGIQLPVSCGSILPSSPSNLYNNGNYNHLVSI